MKTQEDNNYENYFRILHNYELEDLIGFSKTVRVLYVDGDPNCREDSYGIFKIFFHNIDIASNGEEGFELFTNNRYDLIITTLDMQIMNGLEMITKIREISRHITVLVLSSEQKYFIELIRLGIDGYILKPIEVGQFTQIIQKVIEKLQNKQGLYEYRINLEKKVEEKTKELQEINRNLEKRVKEETQKNLENEKRLFEQAKMASLGEMIGNIAHQWRQPLTAISVGLSGLQFQKSLDILEDDHFNETINRALSTTQHLSKTIDDFRDFLSKKKKSAYFDLIEEIGKTVDIVHMTLQKNRIELILPKAEGAVRVNSILGELSQVILNIVNNAIDVLTERKIEKPWIRIEVSKEEGHVVIAIEDNGGGIPGNILPRIFEPYFTTKHKSHGTGLGLYMSYTIITESLQGDLYAQNTPDGAKFFIKLPMKLS